MRVAVGADHAGCPLNERVIEELKQLGHEVIDFGTHDPNLKDDYPDYSLAVGTAIQKGDAERGIVICGSGVGANIAANKMKGVRACMCHDTYSARQGVEHDDMNVLCLGARIVGSALMTDLVRAFMSANFSNEERHVRRLNKVLAMERGEAQAA